MKKNIRIGFISALLFLVFAAQTQASLSEIKAYKAAFPGAKPKCASCHVNAMPKKDAAALNAYGQAAVAANPKPTAETFKQLGAAENFKK